MLGQGLVIILLRRSPTREMARQTIDSWIVPQEIGGQSATEPVLHFTRKTDCGHRVEAIARKLFINANVAGVRFEALGELGNEPFSNSLGARQISRRLDFIGFQPIRTGVDLTGQRLFGSGTDDWQPPIQEASPTSMP